MATQGHTFNTKLIHEYYSNKWLTGNKSGDKYRKYMMLL